MCFAGFYLKEMTCSVNTLNSYCPWSWGILKFGEVQPMCNKCMCVKKMVHPSSLCSSALAVYRASCTPSSPATLNCPCPWTRVTSCHPPRQCRWPQIGEGLTFKLILLSASIFSGVDCLSIAAISAGCERDDGVPWLAPCIIARLGHVEPTLWWFSENDNFKESINK